MKLSPVLGVLIELMRVNDRFRPTGTCLAVVNNAGRPAEQAQSHSYNTLIIKILVDFELKYSYLYGFDINLFSYLNQTT